MQDTSPPQAWRPHFDGSSLVPVLRGQALPADRAIYQYFPHYTPVPDWLPPAISVHRGDWKLIRIFHGGDAGAHRYLLFNLKNDPGENTNVASQNEALVQELDALITQFLADTGAVVPVPNPAFDAAQYQPEQEGKAAPKAKGKNATKVAEMDNPALQGWKPRDCKAQVKQGVLRITHIGDSCFLGFAAGKHHGASTLKLRLKASGGSSHVDWLPGGPEAQVQRADFRIQGHGEWEEVTVPLPATGPLGIVRVYLPMQEEPVEIDSISLNNETFSF